ncbi:OsmC family protein [Streptomyces massasporeus]|uniref:OsmC family protein n=1 Tax=Streptomyces massasporeus TaxID=67324 RepID=A0ABW6LMW5_9ACTN
MGRVVLDTSFAPHDEGELWASLTAEEARRLAGLLLFQAAADEIRVRGHVLTVDQPLPDGGKDTAPTPVELFVAAVASCAAHYAGRYLDRHGESREGLSVRAEYSMADDRPPRVAAISLTVMAPALPARREAALRAVVSHCTVTNTLAQAPEVELDIRCVTDDEAVRETETSPG